MQFSGPLPRYHQLKERLRQRINAGEFAPGEQFPTEQELCEEYGLSRGTVGRAVKLLVDEGWLRREQGKGTFVSQPTAAPIFLRLSSLSDDRDHAGEVSTQLLKKETAPATEEEAQRLRIPVGAPVIRIAQLRLLDGRPLAYESRCFALDLCPQILDEDLEAESIHLLLLEKYRVPLLRTSHIIEARVLSPGEANLLQVEPGSAAFFIDRLTFTTHDRPGTWYSAIYRGDEYRFTAEFRPGRLL